MKNYEIEIKESSFNYKSSYCGNYGIYVIEEENYLDIDRERYYFTSEYTNETYEEIVNTYINSYLLELLNGIKICFGEYPFYRYGIKEFKLEKQIEAYNIINSIPFKNMSTKPIESTIDKTLKIALSSQNMRDIFVLLNRVCNLDEHTFVNMYRIVDSAKTLLSITSDITSINQLPLKEAIGNLDKHGALANNYLMTGIVSRHGNDLKPPGKHKLNEEKLRNDTIKVVREIVNIFLNNEYFNFDDLVSTHLKSKEKKGQKKGK